MFDIVLLIACTFETGFTAVGTRLSRVGLAGTLDAPLLSHARLIKVCRADRARLKSANRELSSRTGFLALRGTSTTNVGRECSFWTRRALGVSTDNRRTAVCVTRAELAGNHSRVAVHPIATDWHASAFRLRAFVECECAIRTEFAEDLTSFILIGSLRTVQACVVGEESTFRTRH